MAAGRIFHWKHGWIKLSDAESKEAARRDRYAAHQKATAAAHADQQRRFVAHQQAHIADEQARRARYIAHLNDTQADRDAQEIRYIAARIRKARG